MKFYDALHHAAQNRRIPLTQISLKMGHASAYVTNGKSMGNRPKVDTAAKMLDTCDYSLCVVPKDGIPQNAIVIDRK